MVRCSWEELVLVPLFFGHVVVAVAGACTLFVQTLIREVKGQ